MKTTAISSHRLCLPPSLSDLLFSSRDYTQLKADAEAQYAQGSYARANEIYARADKTKLSAERSALGRVSSCRHFVALAIRDSNCRHNEAEKPAQNNSKN